MKMILRLTSFIIKHPRATLRSLFIIVNNIYCIPTYLVLMFCLLPIKYFSYKLYYRIEGYLFHWLLANVAMWSWTAGYDLAESGDDINVCMNKKTLVIANHQSTGDVPLLMAAFNAKAEVLPNIMWIMDKLFKYTNFGAVSTVHRDYFITSGKTSRNDTLEQLKKHMVDTYIPLERKWIVLFPEGGFLHKRMAVSKRFAAQNNLRDLYNVTVPRMGAMQSIFGVLNGATDKEIINHNNNTDSAAITPNSNAKSEVPAFDHNLSSIQYILDITIGYEDKFPVDLLQILNGMRPPCLTHLYYRIYDCKNLPIKNNDLMTKWLYEKWYEKEELLNEFYSSGSFPLSENQKQPTLIHQDKLRFIAIHIFFLTSTYINLRLFFLFWGYLMSFFSNA